MNRLLLELRQDCYHDLGVDNSENLRTSNCKSTLSLQMLESKFLYVRTHLNHPPKTRNRKVQKYETYKFGVWHARKQALGSESGGKHRQWTSTSLSVSLICQEKTFKVVNLKGPDILCAVAVQLRSALVLLFYPDPAVLGEYKLISATGEGMEHEILSYLMLGSL